MSALPTPDAAVVAADVARALAEDLGSGDVTAALLPDQADSAYLLCKQDGVIAGRPWFDATHRALDPDVRIEWHVSEGDTVTVDYQGTSWETGEVFDQSFGTDAAGVEKEPLVIATNQVVPGFGAALVGQKVGTKLIVVIPPEYAYGTDPAAHDLGAADAPVSRRSA